MSRTATPQDVIEGRAQWCVVHADCLDVLPTLPKVDAVVTDPPYGIGEARRNLKDGASNVAARVDYGIKDWDDAPPSSTTIRALIGAAKTCVLFGGNYFEVPPSSCWLVWDKLNTGIHADCELAWTNMDRAVRRIAYRWNGMIRENNEERGQHPTQKPVGVMSWVLEFATEPGQVVLDPFCGSGTTGVACVRLGRRFIGIEKDADYAEVARERIEAEGRGLTLKAARAGQVSIFDMLEDK